MNEKQEKMKKRLVKTENVLRDLVYGDNKRMEVNVRYGMLGARKYAISITEQTTLDAYIDSNEPNAIMSFPVLDVTINRKIFTGKNHWERKFNNPSALAMTIHRSARKLPNYETL